MYDAANSQLILFLPPRYISGIHRNRLNIRIPKLVSASSADYWLQRLCSAEHRENIL